MYESNPIDNNNPESMYQPNTNHECEPLNPCHSRNTDMVPNLGNLVRCERDLARPKELLECVLDVRPRVETWATKLLDTSGDPVGFH